MSKQQDTQQDELIERWQELQQALDPEQLYDPEVTAAIEAQKAREAQAWRDTTADTPLFGK